MKHDSIQDAVIADMEARKVLGLERYGTLLHTDNGRDMMQDLYEELLDACCYIKGVLLEKESREVPDAESMGTGSVVTYIYLESMGRIAAVKGGYNHWFDEYGDTYGDYQINRILADKSAEPTVVGRG